MQGSQRVIDLLNKQLTLELSSMDQYLAHSKIYEDWGISKLHAKLAHEYEDELGHAKLLAERILFLEGVPNLTKRRDLLIGNDVKSMMQNDLTLELEVVACVKDVIAICEEQQDYQSRAILQKLLFDTEEDHVYWLEQQLGLIEKIGSENYHQSQMG